MEATLESKTSRNRWALGAAGLMLAAGLLHLWIIPEEWASAPAHGLFMGLAGVIQIAWAIVVIRRPSPILYRFGVVMVVSLIVLWGIARLLPAPFDDDPEQIGLIDAVTKLCEVCSAIALIALLFAGSAAGATRASLLRTAGALIVVGFLLGWAVYGIGKASEPLFPMLAAPAGEHQDEPGEMRQDEPGEEHDEEEGSGSWLSRPAGWFS